MVTNIARKNLSKLRVTAGTARGTRLLISPAVRPMPSRMKQALFNLLGGRIRDAAVLDLFAGTGSIGIEAVSRGARSAVLVEKDRELRPVIETNIKKAGVEDECSVLSADAYRICGALSSNTGPFSIIFLDPPYLQSEDESCRQEMWKMLAGLAQRGIAAPEAVIVLHVRASAAGPDNLPPELEVTDFRHYGTGSLIICRLKKTLAPDCKTLVESTGRVEEEDPECRIS